MSYQKRIFGTDGVRGRANVEPVTAETALKLGRAAAHVFKNRNGQARNRMRHRIVIGKDTRLSGYMLENAISSGVLSMGVDVIFIGPLPTPGVAYVTRSMRADAGIVITASHNPYEDNGIKFFGPDGYKLDDVTENQIEELVFSGAIEAFRPTASEIGKAVRVEDAIGRYVEQAKSSFPKTLTLEGMRIVVDCGHGASYKTTPMVLQELGAEVIAFGTQPNGTNINRECGSMYPQTLCAKVREYRADLGIAHDGDADRVILCDEAGSLVDGDDIMAISALQMLAEGRLANKTLVATVMSNAGVGCRDPRCGWRGGPHRGGRQERHRLHADPRIQLRRGAERTPDLPRAQHHRGRSGGGPPDSQRHADARGAAFQAGTLLDALSPIGDQCPGPGEDAL